jgi:predicted PurR-regulated permease PerM
MGMPESSLRTAGGALLNWWRAVTLESLITGLMWWLGLWALHVPLAPMWALIGALCQFIPNIGGMIALIGPVLTVLFTSSSEDDWYRLGLVLGLYAVIVVVIQLFVDPIILKRTAKVPVWASIFGPIVLGIVIPFWGVLLAPPLLAIVFAFRDRRRRGQALEAHAKLARNNDENK